MLIIDVAGSAKLKLEPGHYCGGKYGFGVSIENWMVDPRFRTSTGFSYGGVIDFKDIERPYKKAVKYQKKHKRLTSEQLFGG